MVRRLADSVANEKARQIEQFAGAHVGLAATHDLAFYPETTGREGRSFRLEKRIALIPITRGDEAWPWERVLDEGMPHWVVCIHYEINFYEDIISWRAPL